MNLNEQLMEALNDIDDRFIEEAEPGKPQRRRLISAINIAAAAFALILTAGLLLRRPEIIPALSTTAPTTNSQNHMAVLTQALAEAEVTSCAIPTWLPEGCELNRIETNEYPNYTETTMIFTYGEQTISITTKTQNSNSSITIDGQLEQEDLLGIISSILWR